MISLLTARELSLSSFDRIRLVAGNEVGERGKKKERLHVSPVFRREEGNLAKLCLQFIKDRVRTILNDISRASLFVIVILNLIVVVNNREAISSLFGISRKKYGDWLI